MLMIVAFETSSGASLSSVGIFAMLSSALILCVPGTSLPKTVYFPSRKFESLCTIKNCDPALFTC